MELRAYSQKQAQEMGFDWREYSAPKSGGNYTGKLVMKIYGHLNIFCYFITDEGEKIRACVWFKYDDLKSYRPRRSDVDFSYVPIGTRWRITLEENSKGRLSWTDAVAVE